MPVDVLEGPERPDDGFGSLATRYVIRNTHAHVELPWESMSRLLNGTRGVPVSLEIPPFPSPGYPSRVQTGHGAGIWPQGVDDQVLCNIEVDNPLIRSGHTTGRWRLDCSRSCRLRSCWTWCQTTYPSKEPPTWKPWLIRLSTLTCKELYRTGLLENCRLNLGDVRVDQ